jgi:hypothetical protein
MKTAPYANALCSARGSLTIRSATWSVRGTAAVDPFFAQAERTVSIPGRNHHGLETNIFMLRAALSAQLTIVACGEKQKLKTIHSLIRQRSYVPQSKLESSLIQAMFNI